MRDKIAIIDKLNAIPLTIHIILGNGGYKSTNIGSGGFKPTNSKNKSQNPILDTKLKKQEEKDDLEETGSGAGKDDEDDNGDVDDNDGNDSHGPISPEEEEEDVGRSGSINLNPKISSKTDEDDDLTTTVENTDEISSKMKYFIKFDYISRCAICNIFNKKIMRNTYNPKQFVFGRKFVHFVFPQLIFLFKNPRK